MGFCFFLFKRITWFFRSNSFDEKYYTNTNCHYPKYGWAYSNNYSQLYALSWGILWCGGVCGGFCCAGGEFILFWNRIKYRSVSIPWFIWNVWTVQCIPIWNVYLHIIALVRTTKNITSRVGFRVKWWGKFNCVLK